jgi:UTP:GlnB (protein PII) uridylyltransferase
MSVASQQINLLLPELRPHRDWLTASRLVVGLVAVVGVLVIAGLWNSWQASRLEDDLQVAQQTLAEQSARTEALERDVAGRATDRELVREMETREQRLAQTRELYEFMSTTSLGNLTGYSEHLKDLSRASFQGLWLTQVSIAGDAGNVVLRGSALQAAMLPDFVGRLSMGDSEIRNQRFSRLTSTRTRGTTGEQVYDFVLETN